MLKTFFATPAITQNHLRSNVEKAHAFAKHLADVFELRPSVNEPKEEEAMIQLL
jgi:hypothetical protein